MWRCISIMPGKPRPVYHVVKGRERESSVDYVEGGGEVRWEGGLRLLRVV